MREISKHSVWKRWHHPSAQAEAKGSSQHGHSDLLHRPDDGSQPHRCHRRAECFRSKAGAGALPCLCRLCHLRDFRCAADHRRRLRFSADKRRHAGARSHHAVCRCGVSHLVWREKPTFGPAFVGGAFGGGKAGGELVADACHLPGADLSQPACLSRYRRVARHHLHAISRL
ncbi:hypothetical protein D3C87_1368270 [compost metagenome]